MTSAPLQELIKNYNVILKTIHKMGVSTEINPIVSLSFFALPVIPHLKLTNRGLFDVDKFEFTTTNV